MEVSGGGLLHFKTIRNCRRMFRKNKGLLPNNRLLRGLKKLRKDSACNKLI